MKRKIRKKIIPMMREPESEYQDSNKDMISSISLERLAIALISFMFGLFVGFILSSIWIKGGA